MKPLFWKDYKVDDRPSDRLTDRLADRPKKENKTDRTFKTRMILQKKDLEDIWVLLIPILGLELTR